MVGRVLQVLTFVAFGVCVLLAIRLLNQPNPVKEPKAGDSLRVADAIWRGQEREVAVTGYLHDGGGWEVRLCNAERRGNPPRCVGPFLYVANLDLGQFNMKKGTVNDRPAQWATEPVTLLGRIRGTEITVSQVLATQQ